MGQQHLLDSVHQEVPATSGNVSWERPSLPPLPGRLAVQGICIPPMFRGYTAGTRANGELGSSGKLPEFGFDSVSGFCVGGDKVRLDIGLILPPQDHIQKTVTLSTALSQQFQAPAYQWRSLIGLLGSLDSKILCGRRHLRPLQYHLKEFFRPH